MTSLQLSQLSGLPAKGVWATAAATNGVAFVETVGGLVVALTELVKLCHEQARRPRNLVGK